MRKIRTLVIIVLTVGIVSLTAALGQGAHDLVGTWTLVSAITDKDGTKSEIFGPNAKGMLVFDANRRYVIVFTSATLPKFSSNNRGNATAEENKAIVGGSLAHFGTYTVDEANKSFSFHIESATFPNWNGTEQKRSFVVSGDELKFTDPHASAGGVGTIVFKRIR
jgi:hypothetical protein